jgi:N-acetylglucosaminyl-diphospho-decaprenol L-rhamnosyltransferase
VIPTLNGGVFLERCLGALERADSVQEVLVLDGGSSDGSPERAAGYAGVRVHSFPGTSFQRRLNEGVRQARSEFILHLNDDAFVDPDTPRRLLEVMHDRPDVAVSGASLRYEDGRAQRSVGRFRTLAGELLGLVMLQRLARSLSQVAPPERRESGVDEASWMPLCCAILRRSAFDAVGGFDERFTFYYDDQDFCRRLGERGWSLAVRWDAGAIHIGGATTMARHPPSWFKRYHENRLIYLRKHYPRAWLVYAALWPLRALLHAALWRLRAASYRRRVDTAAEETANEWAETFLDTVRASSWGGSRPR